MQLIAANNAQSTLAGSITNTATTANLASGSGILFAPPSAGQYFVGTFTDAATGLLHEIVWVTAVTGDQITMQRAQEGTTALNWSANDLFGNLMTAGQLETLVQLTQLQTQSTNYGVDTGVANAYVVGFTPAIGTAPPAGTPIRFLTGNANNGATTINAGWGAAPLVRRDGSACVGGEVGAGVITDTIWDGTHFEYQGTAPATSAAVAAGTDTQSAITPAQLANASFSPSGSMVWTAAITAPAGWAFAYGQTGNRVSQASLFNAITAAATVTLTIASPGVVNWANHDIPLGSKVSFETTGTLPTGLSTATNYYVVNPSTNSFQVAATQDGTPIAFTGSQSGVQTCRYNPFGCGDGSNTFRYPDGRGAFVYGNNYMGGTPSSRLTQAVIGFEPVLGSSGGSQSYSVVSGTESVDYGNVGAGGIVVAGSGHTHTSTIVPIPPSLGLNLIIKL